MFGLHASGGRVGCYYTSGVVNNKNNKHNNDNNNTNNNNNNMPPSRRMAVRGADLRKPALKAPSGQTLAASDAVSSKPPSGPAPVEQRQRVKSRKVSEDVAVVTLRDDPSQLPAPPTRRIARKRCSNLMVVGQFIPCGSHVRERVASHASGLGVVVGCLLVPVPV